MISREELKLHLFNLYSDLNNSSSEMINRSFLFKMTREDRHKYFTNMYLKDNLPVNVSNYEVPFVTKDFDLEVYDKFVDNLDEYIKNQELYLSSLILNHQMAVKIFRLIITMPSPISDVMYLTYFKQMNVDAVRTTLFMSRPTYFRNKKKGFNILLEKLNQSESNE